MKRITLAILALGLLAAPAYAQNASQIGAAQGGANCPKCNLFQADFSGRTLKNKNFAGARLRQADLGLGIFNGSNFSGADMRDVNGAAALFGRVSFAGADLTNATFVGAYLEGANFRGANLSGVDFSGAEMSSATGLTQRQIDAACGDEATELPAGIRIPVCVIR